MLLVVGGTGSLGGKVTHGLLARGRNVRVLVRQGSDYAALQRAGAQLVFGDLKDQASLRRACAGIDVVITTANSARRGGADDVAAVDRAGNRALIEAARAAKVRRFVFVSALGADPASPVDFLRAKGETEQVLMQSGLEWTIVRPNIFMDAWFPMLVEGPLESGAPVTLIGDAQREHSFVAEDDVARFVMIAALHPAAANSVVTVAGPEALNWRNVVRVYEEARGRSIEMRFVPPGQPLPGLPDVVSQLAAGLESYDSRVPMDETCARYGVDRLITVRDFARPAASIAAEDRLPRAT